MALVKFGGGVTQMSGSIGGTTFARNSSGNYARARTTPVNPQSSRQTAVRASLAFLADAWSQDLTPAQRDAWRDYASAVVMTNRLGESTFHSGYNHFQRSNSIRKRSALGVRADGPIILEIPAQDPTMNMTASEDLQTIAVNFDAGLAWANEDSAHCVIFQGQPQNAQVNFFDGPWRILGVLNGDSASPAVSGTQFPVDYAVGLDQRQFIYARIARADGRLSEPFRANSLVTATH